MTKPFTRTTRPPRVTALHGMPGTDDPVLQAAVEHHGAHPLAHLFARGDQMTATRYDLDGLPAVRFQSSLCIRLIFHRRRDIRGVDRVSFTIILQTADKRMASDGCHLICWVYQLQVGVRAGAPCMYFSSTSHAVSIGSASIVNPGNGTFAVSHGLERAHDGLLAFLICIVL